MAADWNPTTHPWRVVWTRPYDLGANRMPYVSTRVEMFATADEAKAAMALPMRAREYECRVDLARNRTSWGVNGWWQEKASRRRERKRA